MNSKAGRVTNISETGIELICHFEELRLSAYKCPAGIWTIGYGTTRYPNGQPVREGDRIKNRAAAIVMLQTNLKAYERCVDDMTRDDLTQNQFDALVSLCYNIGPANFKTASLLASVNAASPDADAIIRKFCLWDKAHIDGRLAELPGLLRRRKSEAFLYNNGTINFFENNQL